MGVMHDESVASGQPRSSRIDFETAAGPDHTTYGYDPAAERPYWVDYPDPITGARQTQRFASIEAYHEFLETRFGVVSEPVPEHMAGRGGGSPGESGAPGAPEATSGGGPDDSTVASGSEETTSTEPSSSAAEDPYADLTLRQLKRLAKTDPQAAEALLDRYRAWRDANDPRLRSAARSDPIAKSILDAPRPNEELAELMGPKGDERPVPHEAGARVRDAQGREKWSGSYESGGMTPEQEALGYPKAQQATHTEVKAIAEAPLGPGETLDITGQYDPCPACRAAMTAASQGGRTVSYWWPGGRFRAVNGTATISFNP